MTGPKLEPPVSERDFIPLRIAVLTVSDSRTTDTDKSGSLLAERLAGAGHEIADRRIVPDEVDELRVHLRAWIGDPTVDIIVSTGGTGLANRDVTPEAIEPFVTRRIPGFGELFRRLSFEEIGTSTIQSRAEAVMCDHTFAFMLPGSTGACRLALDAILLEQLDHRHRPCNFAELLPRVNSRGQTGTA